MADDATSGVPTGANQGAADHTPNVNSAMSSAPTDTPLPAQQFATQRQPVPGGPSRSDLLSAIESIPERVAHAVSELMPQQKSVKTAPAAQQAGGEAQDKAKRNHEIDTSSSAPQSPRSFADWWFGSGH